MSGLGNDPGRPAFSAVVRATTGGLPHEPFLAHMQGAGEEGEVCVARNRLATHILAHVAFADLEAGGMRHAHHVDLFEAA